MRHPQPFLELVSQRVFTDRKLPGSLPERLMSLDKLRELYQKAKGHGEGSIHDRLLETLGVTYEVSEEDRKRIPLEGAAVLVANHPFGILEGPILGSLLPRMRPDVKVMTNFLLAAMPELREFCIFVDPFGGPEAVQANRRGLKEALEWLRGGHLLAIFPAGEVSHFSPKAGAIIDPEWNPMVARLIARTGAPAVPLYFEGTNSLGFQLLGLIHPRLRTVSLATELMNKRGSHVTLRVGRMIPPEFLAAFGGEREMTDYLRWRTYLLGRRGQQPRRTIPLPAPAFAVRRFKSAGGLEPLAKPVPGVVLEAEISVLPPGALLEESRELAVYAAHADEIPNVLREIGRLREWTFRAAGEGTGRALDLDSFDHDYRHLFLWNRNTREVAGAYRLASTSELIPRRGIQGLYSRTLFHYDQRLLDRIGPALELGRSFVRPEYQRQFAPLLLLWKGIGRYLSRNPATPVLFGAVSISAEYSEASRQLLVRYFEAQEPPDGLAGLVKPRRPYRPRRRRGWDAESFAYLAKDLDELAAPIADLEEDGKGVPILVKQYVKLGGRILAFSVDPEFGNCLDGLILVDLRRTDRVVLDRYMTKEGAERFLAHHRTASAA
jgi:putative hemolysin